MSRLVHTSYIISLSRRKNFYLTSSYGGYCLGGLFGDLMLESAQEERGLIDHYRSIGDDATADAIEEEFFWHVDASAGYLRNLGLSVETIRFSTLSWGIKIQVPR